MTSALLAASGGSSVTFPILTSMVALPALGAVAVALVSRRRPELSRSLALLTSVLTGALTIAALVAFDSHDAGFQMVEKATWITDLGISWHLGVDGISLFLVVLTGVLFPIAILAAPAHHDEKPFLRLAARARGRLPRACSWPSTSSCSSCSSRSCWSRCTS